MTENLLTVSALYFTSPSDSFCKKVTGSKLGGLRECQQLNQDFKLVLSLIAGSTDEKQSENEVAFYKSVIAGACR